MQRQNSTVVGLLWIGIMGCGAIAAQAGTRVTSQNHEWTLENAKLRVTVDALAGSLAVLDKTCGHEWRQPPVAAPTEPKFTEVQSVGKPPKGIRFVAGFGMFGEPRTRSTVTVELPDDSADMLVTADMPDRATKIGEIPFLRPLMLDTPDAAVLVSAHCNGHAYPVDYKPFPVPSLLGWRLDMPWVGLCDMKTGLGYMVILETSDDCMVRCDSQAVGNRSIVAPQFNWVGSLGAFAYPRRLLYHFTAKGGYVALAKRYRTYVAGQGVLVPFTEKVKKNPNLERLFGAPDIWGETSLAFARAAKAAGVEKMLIHCRPKPKPAEFTEEIKGCNALGYLTSVYDCYSDVHPSTPAQPLDSNHDRIPENVVFMANGQPMKGWYTVETKSQAMKRCPSRTVAAAKAVIPPARAKYPLLAWFIDVTTADVPLECYNPKHPLSRAQTRQCNVDLLAFVRSQNLVVGGEHGIWWGVPYADYFEGMMGAAYKYASWPAGYLIRPKKKDEQMTWPADGHKMPKWEEYARWGIGHQYRVPLWELVFHDCVVTTWYWGDSSDFLLEAAPEITPKKDAFNILYGTMPMMWVNGEGAWHKNRAMFMRTYRNTCKLHEVVAKAEMLSHEYVTADRAVQRTRFSDGTEVIVNFGPQPYRARLAGKEYLLPENGFAVKGPAIEQSLALVDGRPVTTIHTAKYSYTDASGANVENGSELFFGPKTPNN